MLFVCGNRFRIEDLGGGVSEAVTAGPKGVKKGRPDADAIRWTHIFLLLMHFLII